MAAHWRGVRIAVVGGFVAAAFGGAPAISAAESAAARGAEVVAREAPGAGQAGIAVLRGNDRVQLVGERDGWSEIRLPDGRRAWVPSAEITRISEGGIVPAAARIAAPTDTPLAAESPMAGPTSVTRPPDDVARDLAAEVSRLRDIADHLDMQQRMHESAAIDDPFPWVVVGVSLFVGLVLGSAWERQRSRRERSLKF